MNCGDGSSDMMMFLCSDDCHDIAYSNKNVFSISCDCHSFILFILMLSEEVVERVGNFASLSAI